MENLWKTMKGIGTPFLEVCGTLSGTLGEGSGVLGSIPTYQNIFLFDYFCIMLGLLYAVLGGSCI
jgi:hypothetical protein